MRIQRALAAGALAAAMATGVASAQVSGSPSGEPAPANVRQRQPTGGPNSDRGIVNQPRPPEDERGAVSAGWLGLLGLLGLGGLVRRRETATSG